MTTIEAFVLAGGQSSRMGQDKGLMPLRGKPMVSYVIQTLQRAGLPVRIIAHHPAYKKFNLPLYKDSVVEKGPMGGLLTALENTTADLVLLVGCDMPLISIEMIHYLISSVDSEHLVLSVVEDKPNPLFSLYPRTLIAEVRKQIMADQLRMIRFAETSEKTVLRVFSKDVAHCFQNINDQAALIALETSTRS